MFREKATEVKKKGALERGEFNPKPDSAHLKMYKWWLEHGGEVEGKENFCHYWRVVLFWAPLEWFLITVVGGFFKSRPLRAFGRGAYNVAGPLRRVSNKTWENVFMWASLTILAVVALFLVGMLVYAFVTNTGNALVVLGVVVGIVLGAIGLIFGLSWIVDKVQKKNDLRMEAREEAWLNGEISAAEYFGRKPAKAPGPIKRFFSGVADFLVLLVQIVRVKKWKICPFVEIPDETA